MLLLGNYTKFFWNLQHIQAEGVDDEGERCDVIDLKLLESRGILSIEMVIIEDTGVK